MRTSAQAGPPNLADLARVDYLSHVEEFGTRVRLQLLGQTDGYSRGRPAFALTLPRTTEALVQGRVKFRI